MAYCRFGQSCDVYVLHHVGGFLDCCGCQLGRKVFCVGSNIWSPHPALLDLMIARRHRVAFKNTIRPKKKLGVKEKKLTRIQKLQLLRKKDYVRELLQQEAKRDGKRIKTVGYMKSMSVITHTRTDMIAHLEYHKSIGEKVPQYAIERLQAEIEKFGDKV